MSGTTLPAAPPFGPVSFATPGAPPARRSARSEWALDARLKSRVFLTALVCVLPPAALLGTGRLVFAGRLFWLLLAVALFRLVILGRAGELLCVLVAVSPFVALFREFAFYNVVIAVFGFGMLFAAHRAPAAVKGVLRGCPLFVALAIAMSLYWILSFTLTGSYDVNFRMFELVLTVFVMLLITTKPAMLAAALGGLILTACATGLAMLPYLGSTAEERLGMISIDGYNLGNPISLGVPLALGLLALVVDNGRVLGLSASPLRRIVWFLATASLLALTTSRAAWLVVVGGLAVSLVFGHRLRRSILLAVGISVAVLPLLFQTRFGAGFERGLERTFGEERSARQRTSGRSDQWKVAWYALTESAGTLLHGYGPGQGPNVYARYSSSLPDVQYAAGQKVALHSLIMQVGVEAGFLGLVPMAVWLGAVLRKVWRETRRTRLLFPLTCFLGYVVVVLTVSGNDVFSGLLLGIALSATVRWPLGPDGALAPKVGGLGARR